MRHKDERFARSALGAAGCHDGCRKLWAGFTWLEELIRQSASDSNTSTSSAARDGKSGARLLCTLDDRPFDDALPKRAQATCTLHQASSAMAAPSHTCFPGFRGIWVQRYRRGSAMFGTTEMMIWKRRDKMGEKQRQDNQTVALLSSALYTSTVLSITLGR